MPNNKIKMLCNDCGIDTNRINEYYMVNDKLWYEITRQEYNEWAEEPPPPVRFLCIGCLEGRVGRKLKASDFTNAPLNQLWFNLWGRSERLMDRLTNLADCINVCNIGESCSTI